MKHRHTHSHTDLENSVQDWCGFGEDGGNAANCVSRQFWRATLSQLGQDWLQTTVHTCTCVVCVIEREREE